MSTPASSGGLFFSSSPTTYAFNLNEEVETLVAQAQEVTQLSPQVDSFLAKDRPGFFENLSRRISLIKSRSQALQDAHVNVFDKVLLRLTKNGNDLGNQAAITYFCEEHLGIPVKDPPTRSDMFMEAVIATPILNAQALSPPESTNSTATTIRASTGSRSPEKKHLFIRSIDDQSAALTALAAKADPSVARLWKVYDRAKKDFQAILSPHSIEKQKSAKFLRDTAENTLAIIRGKNPDQRVIDELEMTLAVAKTTAQMLHGGKKRKFDGPEHESERRGSGSGMSNVPMRGTRPGRPGPTDTNRVNTEAGVHRRPQPVQSHCRRSEYPGHARGMAAHRRNAVSAEDPYPYSKFHHADGSPKRQKKIHRGPSGIPYGYSRDRNVDSYTPSG